MPFSTQSTLLELTETSAPLTLEVSRAERRALHQASVGLIIEDISPGQVRVGPRQGYAGSLTLPGGRRIVVRPKAAVGSLPALLALAYRTTVPPERVGSSDYAEAAPTDWLLLQLISEIESVVARGLRRDYRDRRELLPFVRGRLRPMLDASRLPMSDCEYSDFTVDIAENRLLRGTLERVAPAVRHRDVRRRYRNALGLLAPVTLVRPHVADFDSIRLSQLSAYYVPALGLCRLAIEGAGAGDTLRGQAVPAFFTPMWRVWESAVQNAVEDVCNSKMRSQPEYADRLVHVSGDPAPTVVLKPDVVIGSRNYPFAVVDAKWASPLRLRMGRMRLINSHLYQLATYCFALECDGTLVYPRGDQDVDTTYQLAGRRLRVVTVDLAGNDLGDLTRVASTIVASSAAASASLATATIDA